MYVPCLLEMYLTGSFGLRLPEDACTASLVLITCRLCPSLWATPDQSDIITSWEKCNIVLESISSFSPFIWKSFDLLLKINQIVITRQTSQLCTHIIQQP